MSERDLIDELLQAKVRSKLFGVEHAPRLGRLVILEPLGQGGMGTVFAAYDPRLDRKVAVKLVRGEDGSSARVLREARALGKLNHPNVVAVHDATETDGLISIVMELAPGVSLRRWIGKNKPWRDVLAVMQQAGMGLAAAHRSGIVHRDIKPDNIMIGPDRARLVDFGLASTGVAAAASLPTVTEGDAKDSLEGSGTPSYMAPEVLDGAPASAASDQWSFGVTLFEALYGQRPHRGKTKQELRATARRAADAEPARASRIPRWLGRVALRALAADPAARFPTMDALVAELGRDRRRRRRRASLVIAAVVLTAMLVTASYRQGATRDVCGDGRARIRATWPDTGIDRMKASLGGAPWAEKAVADFVELTSAWERSHRRVCEATRVHGGQPESLLELRMRCLDRRFDRMNALGAALGGTLDPDARENVSSAITELPRPERCESLVDAGELALPDDPDQRRRVELAERELDRAWAAYSLGRYRDAQQLAKSIEQSTRDLSFSPFRAALLLLVGSVEARLGPTEQARPVLGAALSAAAEAHAGAIELEVWLRLLRGELFDGNPVRVVEWAPFARAAAARTGSRGSEIDGIEAEARRDAGDLTEARKLLGRALSSGDELRGDQRALIEMNLGSIELASGRPVAAEAAFTRALSLAEKALGQGHPGLALHLDKLAAAARDRGRIGEALERHERALRLRRATYGDSDRSVATTLFRRAQTRIEAGKITAAQTDLERAREIRAGLHGARHRRLGEIDLARAEAVAARGDSAKARELYQLAAALDPRLDAAVREAAVDGGADAIAAWPENAELSLEAAARTAARIARLVERGEQETAKKEAERLVLAWRARKDDVSGALCNEVALAQRRVGRNGEAAAIYEVALANLADEPSRTRLRALAGLAECADGSRAATAAQAALALLDAMPELDSSDRKHLERIAIK